MPTKNIKLARKYRREYYYRNRKQEMLRINQGKERIRDILYQIKRNNPCSCGENDIRCLDFHHDGNKDSCLAYVINKGWGIDRLVAEIEKCYVVCSNCHRKLSANPSRSATNC